MPQKKPAVVLLVTLFFITTISVLIMKNLDDSNQFIKEVSYDIVLTQLQITNENVRDQMKELIENKEKDEIDKIIDITKDGVPFNYGNVKLVITLDDDSKKSCNMSQLNSVEDFYAKCNQYTIENVGYDYDLIQQIKKYKGGSTINTQAQVDFILDKYIQVTKDDRIDEVRDTFGYRDSNNTNIRDLRCSYKVNVDGYKYKSEFLISVTDGNITKLHSLNYTSYRFKP